MAKSLSKKCLNIVMSIMLVLSMATQITTTTVFAAGSTPDFASAEASTKYILKSGSYGTRLKMDYSGNVLFEISFKEMNYKTGEPYMTALDRDQFLLTGYIRVNGGPIMSVKDAGLKASNYGNGESNSTFQTFKEDLVLPLVGLDDFVLECYMPDGKIARVSVTNTMSAEERAKKLGTTTPAVEETTPAVDETATAGSESTGTTEETATTEETSTTTGSTTPEVTEPAVEVPALPETLKKETSFGIQFAGFYEEESGWSEKWGILFTDLEAFKTKAGFEQRSFTYDNIHTIIINGEEFVEAAEPDAKNRAMSTLAATWVTNFLNTSGGRVLTALKKTGNTKDAKVKIIFKDGTYVETGASEETVPEVEPSVETVGFRNCKVNLLHNEQDGTPSMASPVLINDAEVIRTADGVDHLLVHFQVTEIMGANSYCTGLTLYVNDGVTDQTALNTEFILTSGNNGLLIVDLPEGVKDHVYRAHIYSNIMDNKVRFSVSNITEAGTNQEALNSLIAKVNEKIEGKEFYDKSKESYDAAVKAMPTMADPAEKYLAILRGYSKLREKLANPFEGDSLHFIRVEANSAFAHPPGTDKMVVKPWARVSTENGKSTITLELGSYSDFQGRQAIRDLKIYHKDGGTIPFTMNVDKNHEGTCSFEMPYYPDDGVFRTEMSSIANAERQYPTDLVLDYTSIVAGMRPEILQDEIDIADTYIKEDFSQKGKISEDHKDLYTEASFNEYLRVLNDCKEVLLPENRAVLTQETIDAKVLELRAARAGLMYVAGFNDKSIVADKTSGLMRPGNVYPDNNPHPNYAPWQGSRVKFGGKTYKVLDIGVSLNRETNVEEDSGKLLIMAEDYVMVPWNTEEKAVKWNDSHARTYLNGEFYNSFSEEEKKMIVETTLETMDLRENWGSFSNIYGSEFETTDKVFLLSAKELAYPSYGFASPEGRKTFEFYLSRSLQFSEYEDKFKLVGVKPKGNIEAFNQDWKDPTAMYPAMNLSKANIIMTVDANKGFNKGLKAIEGLTSNVWQLVVQGTKADLQTSNEKRKGTVVSLDYSSTSPLIAMVLNNDQIVKIGEVGTNGKASFDVASVADGEQVVLAVVENHNQLLVMSKAIALDVKAIEEDTTEPEVEEPTVETPTDTKTEATVGVALYKKGENTKSMGNGSLVPTAKVTKVEEGYRIVASFKPMKVQKLVGHLLKFKVEGKDVEVLKTDEEGRPVDVAFVVKGSPKRVLANVEVDVMNELPKDGLSHPQDVDFVFLEDLDSLGLSIAKEEPETTPTVDKTAETTTPSKPVGKMKEIDVHLVKPNTNVVAQGNKALVKKAKYVNTEDGKQVFITLSPIEVGSGASHITHMEVEGRPVDVIQSENGYPVLVGFKTTDELNRLDSSVRIDLLEQISGKKEMIQTQLVFGPFVPEVEVTTKPSETSGSSVAPVKDKVRVHLAKSGTNELSMGNGALDPYARVERLQDGYKIFAKFKPLALRGEEGHLIKMSVGGKPVEVLKTDASGNPTEIAFMVKGDPSRVRANVEVDVMNLIAGESSPQDVDFVFDDKLSSLALDAKSESVASSAASDSTYDRTNVNQGSNLNSGSNRNTGSNTNRVKQQPNVQLPPMNGARKGPSIDDGNRVKDKSTVEVHLFKSGTGTYSMGDAALEHQAAIVRNGNGYRVTLKFKPITIRGMEGHIIRFEVNGTPTSVGTDSNGYVTSATFDVVGEPDRLGAVVEVDVMNDIAGKSNPQPVDIVFGKVSGLPSDMGNLSSPSLLKTATTLTPLNAKGVGSKAIEMADGKKEIKGKLVKAVLHKFGTDELSMGNDALDHDARFEELEDGKYKVYLTFKPMKVSSLEGHLIKMTVDGKPVEVVEKDSDGNPTVVAFEVEGKPTKLKATVEVDVMNDIAGGSSPQDVDLILDWDVEESDENIMEMSEELDLDGSNLLGSKPVEDEASEGGIFSSDYAAPVAVGSISLVAVAVWVAKLRHIF